MATEEKHNLNGNNEPKPIQAEEIKRQAEARKRNTIKKMNNWWLWFGVLILVAILIWWLFSMGLAEDAQGVFNGN